MLCQLSPCALRTRYHVPSVSLAVWYLEAAASVVGFGRALARVVGRELNFSKAAEKPFPP
jgi:hypothetical protein